MKKILFILGILTFPYSVVSQSNHLNKYGFGTLNAITISPNNKHIAVTGNRVHIFDTDKLNQISIIKDVLKPTGILFSNDDSIVVLGKEKTDVYDIKNNTLITLSDKIYKAGYLDTDTNTFYLVNDSVLDIYQNYKIKKTYPIKTPITSILISKKAIILGLKNGEINSYKKSDFSLIKNLKGHKSAVTSLSINNDKNILVSGSSRDYKIGTFGEGIIWNLNTGTIIFRTKKEHKEVKSVHIDSSKVYISSRRSILVYKLDSKKRDYIKSETGNDPIFAIHENKMITGSGDDTMSSNYIQEILLNKTQNKRLFSHNSRIIWDLSFYNSNLIISKNNEVSLLNSKGLVNTYPLFSGSKDIIFKTSGQVTGIHLNSSKLTDSLIILDLEKSSKIYKPLPKDIISKRFSADLMTFKNKTYIITNDKLQNITDNTVIIDFKIPESKNSNLFEKLNKEDFFNLRSPKRKFISSDSQFLFYEYDKKNAILNIRNALNGEYLKQILDVKTIFRQHENKLNYMTKSDGLLYILDLNSLKSKVNTASLKSKNLDLAKFNSSYTMLAIKDEYLNTPVIINLDSASEITIRPRNTIDTFAFSPNNRYLLTGNRYGEIEIWDVNDGSYVGVIFTGHLKDDYVILVGTNYDGTDYGIRYFLNLKNPENYTLKQNLFKSLLFN